MLHVGFSHSVPSTYTYKKSEADGQSHEPDPSFLQRFIKYIQRSGKLGSISGWRDWLMEGDGGKLFDLIREGGRAIQTVLIWTGFPWES